MDYPINDGQVTSGLWRSHYPDQMRSSLCSFYETEDGQDSPDDFETEDEAMSVPPSIGR